MSGPDFLSPEFALDPYPFFEKMRNDHPLYFHEGTQAYVLSRYEDVEPAFKNPAFTTESYVEQIEPVHGETIITMEGRRHTRYRNILNPALRGADLRTKFIPVIESNARELIDSFRHTGKVEFISQFTRLFPISVIVEMLGLPKSDRLMFHRWYSAIVQFFTTFGRDPEVRAVGFQCRDELQAYMLPIIAERRKNPGDDLLSTLCTTEIDGVSMDDMQIKSFVSLLLTAGGETTDKALALLLRNLVDRPELMAQVREDRSLIDRAFAETLRYSPPSHMMTRIAREDVEVSGGTIPAGSTVILFIGAANRDESKYRNADTFDLFREDLDFKYAFSGAANHTAFGLGRHFCVGSLLAKLEVNTAMNYLFDAMENIRYLGDRPVEHGFALRSFTDMWLSFEPTAAAAAA